MKTFKVGQVAAYLQAICAVLIALTYLLIAGWMTSASTVLGDLDVGQNWMNSHAIVLRYSFLVSAMGVAAYRNRFSDQTARNIKRLTTWINPITPKHEFDTTVGQLFLVAFLSGVSTLQLPPAILRAVLDGLVPAWIMTATWSGCLSIATAAFGACALAARNAQ